MALFAPDEQDGHPAACRRTNLFKPAQVIARADGDQRRAVINGQHDLKSLYGTATYCLLECNPGGAAVRRTQPARSQLLGQPRVQMPSLHRVARHGETTARGSRLGERTAEHQGLAHPGRRAQHREPMPGLDGMNQPRDGLLMSRHRYIGTTALDKGIPVQSPVNDPTHASTSLDSRPEGADMSAQGAALGNGVVVENLVLPFQGWADSHSDPQGRPRKRGSPRLGFPVSAPSGRQKSATPLHRPGCSLPKRRARASRTVLTIG